MPKTFRRRQKPVLSLFFSFIILATIPIAIYSLLQSKSFDLRQFASEDKTKCTIHIPYVNTKTLEIGRKYQVHIYVNTGTEKIQNLNVLNKENKTLFSQDYPNSMGEISETFIFSPSKLGQESLIGEIRTQSNRYSCEMDTGQDTIFVVEKNYPPIFLTDPYFNALPPSSSLKIGESYEYVLEVTDRDKDQIGYHYSFTPRADWLHKTVLESGKNGELKIRFAGSPNKQGSYLANIFIHDGYNRHLSAQSWVINIGTESSDIPVHTEPKLPILDIDIENKIILEEPQVTKMLPDENSYITNPRQTISVNLVASTQANILEDSIILKLDDTNLIPQSEIIKISDREILLRYTPETNLKEGEHKIYVYFEDSNNLEIGQEWNFTLELDNQEKALFGLPANTFMVFAVGILLLLFAISIPWVLYIAWKRDDTEEYEELPFIKPEGESSFETNLTEEDKKK